MSAKQWLLLYCAMSGEEPMALLERFDVVPCECDDPHCRGWKLELKPQEPRHE